MTLNEATFRMGDRLIFENTSWQFNPDEQWSIVGPNGSGKSFLGEALLGHLPLVRGELLCQFEPPTGFSIDDCLGHIAFEQRKILVRDQVLQSRWQSFEQDHASTVAEVLSYENVMEVNPFELTKRHSREKPRFKRRQIQAFKILGIEHLLDRKLMVLSNGETQKVHLARALSRPLRLLILDEPCTGLDVKSRAHFQRVLQKLMAGSLRIIIITADPGSLPAGITHVMHVDDFRITRTERYFAKGKRMISAPGNMTTYACDSGPKILSSTHKKRPELVRMQNVSVSYGSVPVLRNIDWVIRKGESWALLGPNGSGKTTLLSLISGDHPQAYSNDIMVLGRKLSAGDPIWSIKKNIGLVSPELHLHFPDTFTCLEAVESGFRDTSGLYDKASSHERRTALRWLAQFGIKDVANTRLFELSTGQQRAALLARALVKRPALLILDEPCQGLDPSHGKSFLRMLDHLIREGKESVIYVTHKESEIPRSIQFVKRLNFISSR